MKLETLISIFILVMLLLLQIVEPNVLNIIGLFALGWQIPTMGKWLAARFRKRNSVEA